MAQVNVTFEGSANSNGGAVTTSNTTFDFVGVATGGAAVFSSSDKAHGLLGGRFSTGTTSGITYGQVNFPTLTSTRFTTSTVVTLPSSLSSSDIQVIGIRNTNAESKVLSVNLRPSGDLAVQDAAGTYTTIAAAGSFTLGGKYRIQVYGTIGSTTSNGQFTAKAYLQSSGAQVGVTASSSTANLSAGAFANLYRVGVVSPIASASVGIDDVQVNDSSTTPIGDLVVTNAPPTVTAGGDQTVTLGSTVNLSGTAADSDGTVASRQWTCTAYPAGAVSPAITGATTSTPSFVAASAGVYTFQFTATDNSNATASDSVSVYVPAATVVPSGLVENSGGWTGSYTDIADGSDSTYIASTGTGSITSTLGPAIPNASATLTVRARQTGTGAALTVNLLANTTVVGTWQLANLTATFQDYPLALTKTQVSAITDWNHLRFQAVS